MIAMLAFPIGLRWRGTDHAVHAVYLFHRSGDPLATVASDFAPPIAADELGPVLGAVRTFVETPTAAREFVRFVREFETANEAHLGSWEDATSVTLVASNAISGLIGSRDAFVPAIEGIHAGPPEAAVPSGIRANGSQTPA